MTKPPSITIALVTRNRAHMMPATLKTILAQTLPDFRLWIVDNASDDGTREFLATVRDDRVTVRHYTELLPPYQNWNRAMGLLEGDVVGLLHDDDQYHPRFLESVANLFYREPEVVFSHCRGVPFTDAPPESFWQDSPGPAPYMAEPGLALIRRFARSLSVPVTASFMFRGPIWRAGLQFDARWEIACDAYAMLTVAQRGKVGYLLQPLCAYRRHPQRGQNLLAYGKNREELLQALPEFFEDSSDPRTRTNWRASRWRLSLRIAIDAVAEMENGRADAVERKLKVLRERGAGVPGRLVAFLIRLNQRTGIPFAACARHVYNGLINWRARRPGARVPEAP